MTIQNDAIRITGLDVDRTQPSNSTSGLRHMYLELSSSPSADWIELFEQERSFPRHSKWRHAWIEGNYIVVDCVPEEVEQHHLRDFRENVHNTNQKYEQFLRRVEAQDKAATDGEKAEKKRLNELAARLKFDDQ